MASPAKALFDGACRLGRTLCLAAMGLVATGLPGKAAAATSLITPGRIEEAATPADARLVTRAYEQLVTEVRRRTTLALADRCTPVKLELPQLLEHPLLIWRGADRPVRLDEPARNALRTLLEGGGSLWIDAADGDIQGPFVTSAKELVDGLWPDATLAPLAQNFVLTRSFYLLGGQLGRKAVPTPLRGLMRDNRLVVLLSEGDVLGALARREDGSWALPMEGAQMGREMALRLAINWLMYTTCLDYKDDQVHLPFILRRRSL